MLFPLPKFLLAPLVPHHSPLCEEGFIPEGTAQVQSPLLLSASFNGLVGDSDIWVSFVDIFSFFPCSFLLFPVSHLASLLVEKIELKQNRTGLQEIWGSLLLG